MEPTYLQEFQTTAAPNVQPPQPVICLPPQPRPEDLGESVSRFCYDWLRLALKDKGPEENTCISAASAYYALLLAYVGAKGKTKEEMATVQHLGYYGQQASGAYYLSALHLMHDDVLKVANTLFLNSGCELNAEYAELVKWGFGVEPATVDFAQPEAAAGTINSWVEEKTNNRIKNLVAPDNLGADTSTVLVNAIYLLAKWKAKFEKDFTDDAAKFFVSKEKSVTVPLMFQHETHAVGNNADGQFIALPYDESDESKRKLEMMIFLPNEELGVDGLVNKLSHDYVNECRNSLWNREVMLFLPRFELNDKCELSEALNTLGMPTAFTHEAEFDIVKDQPTKISKVLQKTFMKVDEEGTEAAAATAVASVFSTCVQEIQPVYFRVDRPFLLVVRDAVTGTPLFTARVNDPTAS